MRQITDYKEISPVILKYFKRGVITNNFLTAEDYKAEIAEGRLFVDSTDDTLFIYLKREEFYILYFYTFSKTAELPVLDLLIVSESVGDGAEFLKNNGFSLYTTRIKFERSENTSAVSAEYAEKSDAPYIYRLMQMCFDKYSGYIPTLTQIEAECENNCIIKAEKDSEFAGFIRIGKSGKKLHIKHLCTDEKYRGFGIGRKLTLSVPDAKCDVWTGRDNIPAVNLYKSAGFVLTEAESEVYMKGRGK